MDVLNAIILSIVEGLSEYLPISSTGHMILASTLLKIPTTEFTKSFEIIIQLGAIAAIALLYWKKLLINKQVLYKTLVAFIPTGILGLLFYKIIKHYLLGNPYVTVASLLIGGIILIGLELVYKEKEHHVESVENITYKNAFLIGLFQSVSMIPGVSRAAATIIGALFLGTKRKTAVEFSFLLAIPTMLAATVLDVAKSNMDFSASELQLLTVGFIGAFITALFAVRFLLKFIQSHTFIPFGLYRIVVALLFYLLILLPQH